MLQTAPYPERPHDSLLCEAKLDAVEQAACRAEVLFLAILAILAVVIFVSLAADFLVGVGQAQLGQGCKVGQALQGRSHETGVAQVGQTMTTFDIILWAKLHVEL